MCIMMYSRVQMANWSYQQNNHQNEIATFFNGSLLAGQNTTEYKYLGMKQQLNETLLELAAAQRK